MSHNSCGAYANVSDNKHATCPARMSDGRLFTNYNSRCAIQAAVGGPSDMDSYGTRQYMIHNAASIIQSQRDAAACAARCGPCGKDTMLPELEVDSCDLSKCVRKPSGATDGLGLGRNYGKGHGSSTHADIPGAFTVSSGGRALAPYQSTGAAVDTPWSIT